MRLSCFDACWVQGIDIVVWRGPHVYDWVGEACYLATALSVRDRLIESWNNTSKVLTVEDHKRVYFISFEFM
jgi:starch phosphorylase